MMMMHEKPELLVIAFCRLIFPSLLIAVIWQGVFGILSIPAARHFGRNDAA